MFDEERKKSATMRHSIIASSGKLIEIAERFATLLRAQRATDKPKWENMNFDAVPLPSKQRSGTFSSSARVPNPETCSVLFIISIIQQHTLLWFTLSHSLRFTFSVNFVLLSPCYCYFCCCSCCCCFFRPIANEDECTSAAFIMAWTTVHTLHINLSL